MAAYVDGMRAEGSAIEARRGPARPCPAAADLHRLLDPAVGAPRPASRPRSCSARRRAGRPRPVQPGPGGRDGLTSNGPGGGSPPGPSTVGGSGPGRSGARSSVGSMPSSSGKSARRARRASWSRRTGRRRPAPGRAGPGRALPVQVPTSTVATALPAKLVSARASDMNRSMPTIRPTPSTSSGRCELQAAGQRRQAGAGDAGGALGGDDHEQQQRDLLADRQRVAQRLGDEQRRHRQVDRGAVEVERVAGRHDDADGRLVDAGVLHLGDQPRQRRLRRRGRQDQQELAAEVLAAA